jgi:thioredoxin reductase
MSPVENLPIMVIGAGPVGLAAAAHLTTRGMHYLVLEATDGVAACFRSTAHVRLFSPWKMNVDAAAVRVLEPRGWKAPDPEGLPTAGDMRAQYLEPLAAALGANILFGARVERISRRGFDKVKTVGREKAPFVLRIRGEDGREEELEARAVIDATGTWDSPNWMGASGLPALGEPQHVARIRYGMPDILGGERERYASKRVLVVGAGHSAAGNLITLAELAKQEPETRIAWVVRSDNLERIVGGGVKDGLPERGRLGLTLRDMMRMQRLDLYSGFQIEAVSEQHGKLHVSGIGRDGTAVIGGIDAIIVATGSRPNLSLARELRLRLDPWLESTEQLAPLIDPNVHSCGSVPPHGHRELAHPEVGYYAIGAKSYGRAPSFLLATGYEQARSVVAALAGDVAAADDVQLVLPETGVCRTDYAEDDGAGGCCGPAPRKPEVSAGCCGPSTEPKVKSGCC